MTEVNRMSQTESEPGRKQQALLHYGGPSRLCYFNLALKGDDAATRINALSLERKNCPDDCTTGTSLGVRLLFFCFPLFPQPRDRKSLAGQWDHQLKEKYYWLLLANSSRGKYQLQIPTFLYNDMAFKSW